MKSYMTIRDKCNSKNQSNISSHVKDKYNEIGFAYINITRIYHKLPGIRPSKVKRYITYYSSFQNYKIINHNFSIYSFIKNNKNNQKIRLSIHDMVSINYSTDKYIKFPLQLTFKKYIKFPPKLTERFSIK